MAARLEAMGQQAYQGLTAKHGNGMLDWTGVVRTLPDRLELPRRWKKPRRVFVNSMSDLFHESVPIGFIERVFATMAIATQHTFQILTKRPQNLLAMLNDPSFAEAVHGWAYQWIFHTNIQYDRVWPLPNVWLGVSVSTQADADALIPLLLQTPAAVRWVSYEPAIEAVAFRPYLYHNPWACNLEEHSSPGCHDYLDWGVFGFESGPKARPGNLHWFRTAGDEFRAVNRPYFIKQLGSVWASKRPHLGAYDRKGGNPSEWPADLRVREYPNA